MLNTPDEDTVYSIITTLGREIWSTATTPAGLLVTLSGNGTTDVTAALQASGYTVTEVCADTVMVGGVDELALLDAQIAALTEQRERLAVDRTAEMGGPF